MANGYHLVAYSHPHKQLHGRHDRRALYPLHRRRSIWL